MRTFIAFVLVALASVALAKDEVYKWVDEDGVVHYTDRPTSEAAKPAKLPPLQTYKGGTSPDLRRYDKSATSGEPAGQVLIDLVTPAHDETFRGGERTVPVAVVVTPALREGQRLIYLLDGVPASLPTSDTSFAFTGVDRGSHTAAAKVIDAEGNELASSTSVTFHMKPPIARKPAPKPKPKS